MLVGADGLSRDDSVESGAEVFSGNGDVVAGAACVELAAIDELEAAVEEEEVGRAGCVVGARDGLAFVIEIRERKAELASLLGEVGGRVFRKVDRVVATHGDNADAFAMVVTAKLSEGFFEVLNEGTVAADEHDEEALGATGVVGAQLLVGDDIPEGEAWCGSSKSEHCGFSTGHDVLLRFYSQAQLVPYTSWRLLGPPVRCALIYGLIVVDALNRDQDERYSQQLRNDSRTVRCELEVAWPLAQIARWRSRIQQTAGRPR